MSKKVITHKKDAENDNWLADYHRRWSIDLGEEERWSAFRERVRNAYIPIGTIINNNSRGEDEFFEIIGIHKSPPSTFDIASWNEGLNSSHTYHYFAKTNDIKKFVLGLEVLFKMQTLTKPQKDGFLSDIQGAIHLTGVPLGVKQTDMGVVFYPAGAKLLDEKLINDNLDWLSSHPRSYEPFKRALSEVSMPNKERDVVDNLRLSLELILKDVLGNEKSLENQKEALGAYFKLHGVSTEISNLFMKMLLDYYAKYQNDKAKHNDAVKAEEVEFILYLTGTMIRFVTTR